MIAEARRGVVAGDAGIFIRPKRFFREWVYSLKKAVPTEFRFWDEDRLEWFVSSRMEPELARTIRESFDQELSELLCQNREELTAQIQQFAVMLPQDLEGPLSEYAAKHKCSVLNYVERACRAQLRRDGAHKV